MINRNQVFPVAEQIKTLRSQVLYVFSTLLEAWRSCRAESPVVTIACTAA